MPRRPSARLHADIAVLRTARARRCRAGLGSVTPDVSGEDCEVLAAAFGLLMVWVNSWPGIGHVAAGMHRRGFDLQLTQYDERGWRATFSRPVWSTRLRARPGLRGSGPGKSPEISDLRVASRLNGARPRPGSTRATVAVDPPRSSIKLHAPFPGAWFAAQYSLDSSR